MRYLASMLAIVSMLALTWGSAAPQASATGLNDKGTGADKGAPIAYSCGAPDTAKENTARCFAQMRLDVSGPLGLAPLAPSGFGPADLRSAYKLAANGGSGQTVAIVDAYNDPERRVRPGASTAPSTACPPAPRPTAASARSTRTAAPPTRRNNVGWARGDLARPRHGQRHLPELPYPAGRGQQRTASPTWPRRWTARRSWAPKRSATATAAANTAARPATSRTTTTPASPSPSRSGDSGYGVEFPAASQYVTAVGGTHLVALRHQPRLDRDGLERRGQRLQPLHHQAELAARHRLHPAHRGRRRRGRRPEHRRGRLRHLRRRAAGWSSAAPASPRRSSPASTRWPATAAASPTAPIPTATPAACST